jgi:Glycosyl transferase family 2
MTLDERSARSGRRRPKVVCLLPVRNAADELPRWFDSVARFADSVVALDDGSTDRTAELLRSNPLVVVLLENPRRETYAGWDDSQNRNRLLAAAGPLEPDWIISIDADELVPREDGDALRRFVEEQAVPGIAYGFPVYRMIGDVDHYDACETISYRLFAHRPGQVFPPDRLHFDAVPTSIPRGRWLVTNLRIQHLSGLTHETRLARREKYREADSEEQWTHDDDLAPARPGEVTVWSRRRDGTPVLLESRFPEWRATDNNDEFDPEWPVLSLVVVVGEDTLEEMMDVVVAIDQQRCRHPFEVLVVARDVDVGDDVARIRPGTTVVVMPPWSTAAACPNVGLRVARGDYVIVLDAPVTLAPGAFDEIVGAHDRGCAVVSGETMNLTPSAAGWASYFDGGERCSFTRDALLEAGGFDEWIADGRVARARDRLIERGHLVARSSAITFGHRPESRTSSDYVRARLARGRATVREARRTGAAGGLLHDWPRLVSLWSDHEGGPPDVVEGRRRVRALRSVGILADWAGGTLARRPRP